jgi:hypothetical protein
MGTGDLASYKKRPAGNTIIVLDYNSREAWIQAFRLGARAVIFVRDKGPLTSDHFHYTHASANIPRYFFNGLSKDLPLGETVTIHSEVVFERAVGRNILATIKGSEATVKGKIATFNKDRGEESFLLAADLDTYGEVPELSKGARSAANCAGLLQLAERIAKETDPEKKAKRNVIIAFFDARWNGHAGASAFYKWIDPKKRDDLYDDTKNALEKETEYVNKILALANETDPLSNTEADVRYYFLEDLKSLADNKVFDINDKLVVMRWDIQKINMKIQKLDATDDAGKIDGYNSDAAKIKVEIDKLSAQKVPWNDLRRALNHEKKGKSGGINDVLAGVEKNSDKLTEWKSQRAAAKTETMTAAENAFKEASDAVVAKRVEIRQTPL